MFYKNIKLSRYKVKSIAVPTFLYGSDFWVRKLRRWDLLVPRRAVAGYERTVRSRYGDTRNRFIIRNVINKITEYKRNCFAHLDL